MSSHAPPRLPTDPRDGPRILDADPRHPQAFEAALDEAARVLRAGGLVAFPTETVYGLGANALDAAAVRKIFAAKGRPSYNPVIVHIAHVDELPRVARTIPPLAQRLAAAFWPGPLTLVLPRAAGIPDEVTAGLDGVGVRVPAHPVARALIARAGTPIAAPSANPFTRLSPTTAEHVATQLGNAVALILDGGPADVGIESTVVDACGERPVLLRPGGIPREALERVVGPVDDVRHPLSGTMARPAPGMIERHYAPRARLEWAPAASDASSATPARDARHHWSDRAAALAAAGERVGVLAFDASPTPAVWHAVAMPPAPADYARALYAALHACDDAGCSVVLVAPIPRDPSWDAIADRLRRAGLPMGEPPR